jgi:four helix bundle protein
MQPATSFHDLRVWIALGSQAEVEVQLLIANRLGYCTGAPHETAMSRTEAGGKMSNGLIASLQVEDE